MKEINNNVGKTCSKCGADYLITSVDFKPICKCNNPKLHDLLSRVFDSGFKKGESMNLIKAKFLNNDGLPHGRQYTYDAGQNKVEVGDLVQLNENGVGVVTEIGVDEKEVEAFKDRLKTIVGKLQLEEE